MKPVKLEFVIFKIDKERAVKLWSAIVRLIEIFGYDVSGVVIDLPEEYDPPEVSVEDEQNTIYYHLVAKGVGRYERGK